MDEITIDGLSEDSFRRSIESLLRQGRADEAAQRLRSLVEPFAGEGRVLPARILSVTPDDIVIGGWDDLEGQLEKYDRPDHQISAFAITIVEPEGKRRLRPDESGNLTPCVETAWFSDEAYPFSEADRSDLLEGYSLYGCEWQGDCEEADRTVSVEGIDDLYGAIQGLEQRLLSSDEPNEDDIRAGSLGACYLAVLIHQAVLATIRKRGLPRTLCVMTGANGVYPFFDAPVISSEEYLDNGTIQILADTMAAFPGNADTAGETVSAAPAEDFESLLSINLRKTKKKPVITLDPIDAEASASLDWMAAAQIMGDAVKPYNLNKRVHFDVPGPPGHAKRMAIVEQQSGPRAFDTSVYGPIGKEPQAEQASFDMPDEPPISEPPAFELPRIEPPVDEAPSLEAASFEASPFEAPSDEMPASEPEPLEPFATGATEDAPVPAPPTASDESGESGEPPLPDIAFGADEPEPFEPADNGAQDFDSPAGPSFDLQILPEEAEEPVLVSLPPIELREPAHEDEPEWFRAEAEADAQADWSSQEPEPEMVSILPPPPPPAPPEPHRGHQLRARIAGEQASVEPTVSLSTRLFALLGTLVRKLWSLLPKRN